MPPTIDPTYAEAFDGLFSRFIITADNRQLLERATLSATALPSTVFGKSEAGVEKWLLGSTPETPDKRIGALVQVWVNYGKDAPKKLESELGWRIRQGVLVVPTTAVFNALGSDEKIDTLDKIGHCGDGYEWEIEYKGRKMLNVPIMMGYDFRIERYLGYAKGVAGGNVWLMCRDYKTGLRAANKALDAIHKVEGVITAFDICSAGSKVETNFPEIGPSTNHWYCPTLRGRIKDSMVPEGVGSIPEIVINGISLDAVKRAMRAGINAVKNSKDVIKISAGNYGGKLGKYKIYLSKKK
jgi:formylmethanofuran--tetrahydromethanopterin N-formyltransferase